MPISRCSGAIPQPAFATRRSPKRISPLAGTVSPASRRSSVLFPQPDGPSSATMLPASICRSILLRTVLAPKAKETLSSLMPVSARIIALPIGKAILYRRSKTAGPRPPAINTGELTCCYPLWDLVPANYRGLDDVLITFSLRLNVLSGIRPIYQGTHMSRFPPRRTSVRQSPAHHGPTILITSYDAQSGRRNVDGRRVVDAVEFAPPRVAIVVDKSAWTREIIERNGTFGIGGAGRGRRQLDLRGRAASAGAMRISSTPTAFR
ncbi:Uncharacterised protein [Raoultella terrigena]|uniref:Uncharacterized protein n=1 Tax=Raoultella terrigena TaxID=577 RepID=A0A3P8IZF3_RAOTE|nr:Uncharacterised protein [Raoultella terrigena]